MKSPFTGGEVVLEKELRTHEFRGLRLEIMHHYYRCKDTGETFTDTRIDELNLTQLHNLYREKEGIPYKDEIIEYRKQYGLPATKLSLILGFGINMYGKYEAGEIPSVSNGRMIHSICKDPEIFKRFFQNNAYGFDEKEKIAIIKKIDEAIEKRIKQTNLEMEKFAALGHTERGQYTGYANPDLNKARQMVLYFAIKCRPFVTKMNKLLFYADFFHYKKTGVSISGMTYQAITNGPVPQRYAGLIDNATDLVERVDEYYPNDIAGERLISDHEFDSSLFSVEELKTLEEIAFRFKKTPTKEIVSLSHQEDAWVKNNETHNIISYHHAFTLKVF